VGRLIRLWCWCDAKWLWIGCGEHGCPCLWLQLGMQRFGSSAFGATFARLRCFDSSGDCSVERLLESSHRLQPPYCTARTHARTQRYHTQGGGAGPLKRGCALGPCHAALQQPQRAAGGWVGDFSERRWLVLWGFGGEGGLAAAGCAQLRASATRLSPTLSCAPPLSCFQTTPTNQSPPTNHHQLTTTNQPPPTNQPTTNHPQGLSSGMELLARAYQSDPGHPGVLSALSHFLLLQGHPARALQLADAALQAADTDALRAYCVVGRARAAHALGRLAEAERGYAAVSSASGFYRF